MSILLYDLNKEQIVVLLIFSLIMIIVCGLLHLVKLKYKDKIDKSNNKFIKKLFDEL